MVTTVWLAVQHLLVTVLVAGEGILADGVVDGPEPEDVKAGWTAFALFILLALAVAVLGRSLITQLRKAQRAADEGVYDVRGGASATTPADDERGRPGEDGDGPGTGDDGRNSGGTGRA